MVTVHVDTVHNALVEDILALDREQKADEIVGRSRCHRRAHLINLKVMSMCLCRLAFLNLGFDNFSFTSFLFYREGDFSYIITFVIKEARKFEKRKEK